VLDARPLEPLLAGVPRPELAVNLHGRGPESHRVLLALRPGRLVAFGCDAAGVAGPAWREAEHEVHRWCRLLRESGVPADPTRLDLLPPPSPGPPWLAGATLLHPGAASGSRRWPAERWAAVAREEVRAGRRVAVSGSPGEVGLARAVARGAGLGEEAVLAGRTGVLALAGAVAAAGRVASGDTGVAHLATALGTPSVTLFGPTPPDLWGPPDRPRHRVLWHGRGRGDPHGAEPDPALLAIGVQEVVAALAACGSADGAAGRSEAAHGLTRRRSRWPNTNRRIPRRPRAARRRTPPSPSSPSG
jgi:glycosyl transferase family 9 (putative heptosyltransferase)